MSIKLKEIKAANNHMNLVVDPLPNVSQRRLLSRLTPWLQLCETLKYMTWFSRSGTPDSQELGENKCVLFEATVFVVILLCANGYLIEMVKIHWSSYFNMWTLLETVKLNTSPGERITDIRGSLHQKHLEALLVKHRLPVLPPEFDSAGLGWGLKLHF